MELWGIYLFLNVQSKRKIDGPLERHSNFSTFLRKGEYLEL